MTHLPLLGSDHCGLWIKASSTRPSPVAGNYFKFLGSWLEHPDFEIQVRNSWRQYDSWVENVQRLTSTLKQWNKDVVGNIFQLKRRIIRRLEGISNKLLIQDNERLVALRSKLWEEYCQIVHQEESYWFQQAKSKWIAFGDKNNKFFHQAVLIRRRQNRITALKDNNDSWVYDEDGLRGLVLDFYSSLYASNGAQNVDFHTQHSFPPI